VLTGLAVLAVLRTDAATRAIQARDEAINQNEHLKMELGRCVAPSVALLLQLASFLCGKWLTSPSACWLLQLEEPDGRY
jgi:hypothetical protein